MRRCTAADASIHAPSRLRTHIETCLKIVCTSKSLRRRGCARSRAPPLDPPLVVLSVVLSVILSVVFSVVFSDVLSDRLTQVRLGTRAL